MTDVVNTNHDISISAEGHTQRSRIISIAGACAGNLVEWYDFFVYAYASIYFASAFFPAKDETGQLMASAGVFALGFLIRPIGGWVFGRIADTRGRKIAMIISVAMMCGGSLLIACLPTYETVGLAAPALLLTARLVQGLSTGAEYGTGAAYLAEVSEPNRRAFYSSFQYVTIIGGQLLGLLTVTILQQLLTTDALKSWGWRIPFVIGAVGALVISVLRRTMHETVDRKSMQKKEAGSLKGLLRHKKGVIAVLMITMGTSLYYYTFTTYMQKLLVVSAGFSPATASFIMTSALIFFMIAQPFFGLLNDRIGINRCVKIYASCAVVFVVPILYAIRSSTDPVMAFLLVLTGLMIGSLYTPVAGLYKAELFPAEVRAIGVGLPYAIGLGLFGATAEYVGLWLRSVNHEPYYFFYVALANLVTLLIVMTLPNLARHGYVSGDGSIEENTRLGSKRATT